MPELLTGAAVQTNLSVLVHLAFALSASGCGLIGYGIGAASDANAPKEFTRLTPLDALSVSSPLTLITTYGDTVRGELVGSRKI